MSLLQHNENFSWYNSIEDAKADGFGVVHVTSLLCFFRLRGKTTSIAIGNFEVIPDLRYLYFVLVDEDKPRYYVKNYRGYNIENLWFYRPNLTFSGEDEGLDIFRNRCKAGDVHLLLNSEQVAEISSMLTRLYKGYFKEEGKLSYRLWLALAENAVQRDDYEQIGKNLIGFKTMMKIFATNEKELWDKAKTMKR